MDRLIILANFHVDVSNGKDAAGNDKPPTKKAFTKGMVVNIDDLPEGQSADDWIEKELAKAA